MLLGRSSDETPVWQIMSAPVVESADRIDRWLHAADDRAAWCVACPSSSAAVVLGMLSIGDLVKAVIDDQKQTIEQLGFITQ
ncbi:MAG: hypothetical protein U1F11_07665 [Steroidobacteraceae bacterium]